MIFGSIWIHVISCHVMLRTLLCPAACGPSHKFEYNFTTCVMGVQQSTGVVAALPHRVNLKIQGEVPLVALFLSCMCLVFTCMAVSMPSL